MHPYKLKTILWKLLRNYSLGSTPSERRLSLFSRAPTVLIPSHPFCIQVERSLKSSLELFEELNDITVQFVKGRGSSIDAMFDQDHRLLKVHDKWLDYSQVHQTAPCIFYELKNGDVSSEDIFFCDDAVNDLFEAVLTEVQDPLKLDHRQCRTMKKAAAKKLLEMPRHVLASATENHSELLVSWAGAQSRAFSERYGKDMKYSVVLHKMNVCETKKSALLYTASEFYEHG